MRSYFKRILNHYFPVKGVYTTTKRKKMYWLFLLSNYVSNKYSNGKKKLNEMMIKYGSGILCLLLIIILGGYIYKYKFINEFLYAVITCSDTPDWLSAIGTVGATTIALTSIIHHKSHVGMDVNINYDGAFIQIMNRSKNATFIKLDDMHMCNKNGQPIKASVDFSECYGIYRTWIPLKPYGCYTFKLVTSKNNKDFIRIRNTAIQTNKFYDNNPVSKLKITFLINDHYYVLTKLIDFEQIMQNVHGVN